MKKTKIITSMLVILIGVITWMFLSDYELGKYDTLQEAIEKSMNFETKDVIFTTYHDGVTIVLHSIYPDKNEFPNLNDEVIGIFFFEGNDENGWRRIGTNGWEHYENENMTVYDEHLMEYDSKGNSIHEFHVVFGKINNAEIVNVETKANSGNAGRTTFEPSPIIDHKGGRYYFKIGEETIVRGLSKNGEVIDRQGG